MTRTCVARLDAFLVHSPGQVVVVYQVVAVIGTQHNRHRMPQQEPAGPTAKQFQCSAEQPTREPEAYVRYNATHS
jgi:hypothetical protein